MHAPLLRYCFIGTSVCSASRRLMSDQAPAFEGKVIKSLCDYLGMEKVRTTAYHPQSNGQVERIHQTLMRMIGKLDPDRRKNWPSHLGAITHVYNSTRSLVTGYSPYYLMFGRRPCLPVDLIFPTVRRDLITENVDKYVWHCTIGYGKPLYSPGRPR